jgi:2-succinyl-6-hydroxy-2,4-cyclohexadiene-1-carboxylate synthase
MNISQSSKSLKFGGIDVHLRIWTPSERPRVSIVALHGFTGSGKDWLPLIDAYKGAVQWICPDLPGHGKTRCPLRADYFSLDRLCALIRTIRNLADAPAYLLGYSMGGRVALHFRRHERIPTFVIGANPGIDAPEERFARLQKDTARIPREMSIKAFCQSWEEEPIIQPQLKLPEPLRSEIADRRRRNDPEALRLALIALSPGRLPSLWPRLGRWGKLIAAHGESDLAYQTICSRMQATNPEIQIISIPQAAHAAHLDNPTALAEAIKNWIR